MVRISLNNNKGYLDCGTRILNEIVPAFQIRVPGAFWSPAYRSQSWDGKMKFISERGYFQTGLLPQVIAWLDKNKYSYEIVEHRDTDLPYKWPFTEMGGLTLRDYQSAAIESVVTNQVGGVLFPRGILSASTNAGKTLIAAGLYKAFKKQPTILLINNKTLFEQFEDELPTLIGDDFGVISAKKFEPRKFTMAMVPTVLSRLSKLQNELIKVKICLVDECHLSTSKSYKTVLAQLYNAIVRIGLSGSALNHKDKTKNQKIRSYFGDILHTVGAKELEQKGFSVPLKVYMLKGNKKAIDGEKYAEEYDRAIVKNDDRNKLIWKKVRTHIRKERLPILITIQRHEHIKQLLKHCPRDLKADYLVKFIHHKVSNRKEILDEFKDGKVDILISSMIIKIGQNMPLIKGTIFAGGGDSDINTLQLLGRNKRTHKSKSKVVIYDFRDQGRYILRHSKHRENVYRKEGHEVIRKY